MFDNFVLNFGKRHTYILVCSVAKLENNKILVRYLLDNEINCSKYRGLFEYSYIDNYYEFYDRLIIGEWIRVELGYEGNIIHLFESKK